MTDPTGLLERMAATLAAILTEQRRTNVLLEAMAARAEPAARTPSMPSSAVQWPPVPGHLTPKSLAPPPKPAAAPAKSTPPASGAIDATWEEIKAWTNARGTHFDGDMRGVNAGRKAAGLPPFVLVQPFGPGSTPSKLPLDREAGV